MNLDGLRKKDKLEENQNNVDYTFSEQKYFFSRVVPYICQMSMPFQCLKFLLKSINLLTVKVYFFFKKSTANLYYGYVCSLDNSHIKNDY